MKPFKNILAATDTRLDIHPIVDEAAQLAHRNGAKLKLVDVVPDFPWTARMIVKDHEDIRQVLARTKQEKLDVLASALRDEGIDVETKVLSGRASVEIIREVLRERHDLVLRVAKGHESRHKGFFGATGRQLLRDCPCAVWLVAAAETADYKHVMGCIDTSTDHELDAELNNKVYELASTIGQQHDARCSTIHAWHVDGESLLEGRMPRAEFERLRQERREYIQRLLTKFLKSHGSEGTDSDVHMLKGDPVQVIPAFAKENDVDLVVMGTVARSGMSGMIIGNTAESILNAIHCSVLAVKPDNFVSPINGGEYIAISGRRSNEN